MIKVLLSYEGSSAALTGSPRSIIKEAYAVYLFLMGISGCKCLKTEMIQHIFMTEMQQRN